MKIFIRKYIRLLDQIIAKTYLKYFRENNLLVIFLFHSILNDEKDLEKDVVFPALSITKDKFRQFIEHFLENGYAFIKPSDILNSLETGKYAMITFDDGYFNNYNALSCLNEYKIPAVFYLSTSHIKRNKCFWWDVLYRERRKLGVSSKKILSERKQLKLKTSEEIESYLISNFGKNSLRPICDIDRPFTPSELRLLSHEEYIFWGNHTSDHAILKNYSTDEIRVQIKTANKEIYEMTGQKPISIAYPNGLYSDKIIGISTELGLRLGVTIEARKNRLPIKHGELMTLGRFSLNNRDDIRKQCEVVRSNISITFKIQNAIRKLQVFH